MTTLVKSIHPQFIYHLRSSFLATLRWWPIFFHQPLRCGCGI